MIVGERVPPIAVLEPEAGSAKRVSSEEAVGGYPSRDVVRLPWDRDEPNAAVVAPRVDRMDHVGADEVEHDLAREAIDRLAYGPKSVDKRSEAADNDVMGVVDVQNMFGEEGSDVLSVDVAVELGE